MTNHFEKVVVVATCCHDQKSKTEAPSEPMFKFIRHKNIKVWRISEGWFYIFTLSESRLWRTTISAYQIWRSASSSNFSQNLVSNNQNASKTSFIFHFLCFFWIRNCSSDETRGWFTLCCASTFKPILLVAIAVAETPIEIADELLFKTQILCFFHRKRANCGKDDRAWVI